jgi:hypothetical protein
LGPAVITEGVNDGWLEIDSNSHVFDISAFDGKSQDELPDTHLLGA